jgi:hypothetical protein
MKQYIIMISMVSLGIFIYGLIMGDGDSLLNAVGDVFKAQVGGVR